MPKQNYSGTTETIVAVATPAGVGGVGVIRVSGSLEIVTRVAKKMCGGLPTQNVAKFSKFLDSSGNILDSGLLIYFKAPASFTGEHVLELQGHAGFCVQSLLVKEIVRHGARLARPGEFSQRAFLNDKIDLAQAEAIIDLIHAQTEQAALGASKSLQGGLSAQVQELAEKIINVRVYVEASIDFPDEDIELLAEGQVSLRLSALLDTIQALLDSAQYGQILNDGYSVALLGRPNVGKSSLFNLLLGRNRAIVTPVEGTTRDILSEKINVNGVPVTLLDMAGIRDNADLIEQEGILRAHKACEEVEHIVLVVDASATELLPEEIALFERYHDKILLVYNKVDLGVSQEMLPGSIQVSAKNKQGVEDLLALLHEKMVRTMPATTFTCRKRHVVLIEKARDYIVSALNVLSEQRLECVAQELHDAHSALYEVTGKLSSDELLGEIFSNFCIGK